MVRQQFGFFHGSSDCLPAQCFLPHFGQLNGTSTVWIFFHWSSDCLPARMSLATLWVADWFVTSVDFFMGLQIAYLRECFLPHFGQLIGTSTMWIFSWVFRLLACANILPHFKAEWFLNSVDFFTGLQITCQWECLATLWAAEWFQNSHLNMTLSHCCLSRVGRI